MSTTDNEQPYERQDARTLREQRIWILSRHDSGALAPQVFVIIKFLECEIAWREFKDGRRG